MRITSNTPCCMGEVIRVLKQAENGLKSPFFATEAPRGSTYFGSQYWPVMRAIHELDMPRDWSFADLGSGLGNICFPAATHFNIVVGFELDTALFNTAVRCGQVLGFDNVHFRQEDFLAADLRHFNVIFFFKPFNNDFVELMSRKMRELSPGTRVIANTVHSECNRIFEPRSFEQIFTLEGRFPLRSKAERYATYLKVEA
jgi:protein-L-isoaspartate O-methyltransferase